MFISIINFHYNHLLPLCSIQWFEMKVSKAFQIDNPLGSFLFIVSDHRNISHTVEHENFCDVGHSGLKLAWLYHCGTYIRIQNRIKLRGVFVVTSYIHYLEKTSVWLHTSMYLSLSLSHCVQVSSLLQSPHSDPWMLSWIVTIISCWKTRSKRLISLIISQLPIC